jgi:hypothetical protein
LLVNVGISSTVCEPPKKLKNERDLLRSTSFPDPANTFEFSYPRFVFPNSRPVCFDTRSCLLGSQVSIRISHGPRIIQLLALLGFFMVFLTGADGRFDADYGRSDGDVMDCQPMSVGESSNHLQP